MNIGSKQGWILTMGLHKPSKHVRHSGYIDYFTLIGVDRSQFDQEVINAILAKWGIVINEQV
jgi:hypothetical protein